MHVVNVTEAKTQLPRLLANVEPGQEVVIARRGQPVAQHVRYMARDERQFGATKGKTRDTDVFFKPLPEEEMKLWEGR